MSVTFMLCKDRKLINGDVLNVSNQNAIMLLEMLDIEPFTDDGLVGEIRDVAKLEHNCQQILATLRSIPELDRGRKTIVDQQPGKCTMIECALPDGYLVGRLEILRRAAEEALLKDLYLVYA
jgi:hypothetical protein